ncbi:hypothetical protein BCR35DRAFT_11158 [Leucosporidium creatinivorum]|uniref:Uncharacterized protein n=1 Tax=Leucosporidium creatinivorum TaxID=106004 RepID=A0A1Y2G4Q7_9BASI|nr:hypothetical protein BCR35DRAFT_11158 [Leucosporidium creatinivorum]
MLAATALHQPPSTSPLLPSSPPHSLTFPLPRQRPHPPPSQARRFPPTSVGALIGEINRPCRAEKPKGRWRCRRGCRAVGEVVGRELKEVRGQRGRRRGRRGRRGGEARGGGRVRESARSGRGGRGGVIV